MIEVRPVRPDEYEAAGDVTVAAYAALGGDTLSGGYEAELRDIEHRSKEAEVLVAVDAAGTVLGAVAYIPDELCVWGEDVRPGEASMRMLAVSPDAQGRGVGELLARACVERARAAGKHAIFLHSTPWMTTAHRLYERLGFLRVPERDWLPVPEVPLLAFALRLDA